MMSAIKNVKKANKIISANICAASLFTLDFMGNIYMKEFKSSAMSSLGGNCRAFYISSQKFVPYYWG